MINPASYAGFIFSIRHYFFFPEVLEDLEPLLAVRSFNSPDFCADSLAPCQALLASLLDTPVSFAASFKVYLPIIIIFYFKNDKIYASSNVLSSLVILDLYWIQLQLFPQLECSGKNNSPGTKKYFYFRRSGNR